MDDLHIRGGHVVDGTGAPGFAADVAVKDGRITEVGDLQGSAARTIDATGLVVAPGFVDMHTHSDLQLLANPSHECKVLQGCTLEVLGQDGLSYAPCDDDTLAVLRTQLAGWNDDPPGFDWSWRSVGEYLDRLDDGIAVNACYLLPHGTIRMLVMGAEDRPPFGAELEAMREHVARGLAEGAVGLSTGLTYTPGMYATDDEIVALCEPMAGTGAFYCPHHRNYGAQALAGYADSVEIARRAGVPLHLAHCHLGFECNRGKAPELLSSLDAAREAGMDITLDTYPYLAGSTYLHAFVGSWVNSGGPAAARQRLADPALRERIRVEMEVDGTDGHHGVPIDWSAIVVSSVTLPEHRSLVGRSIADIAASTAVRPVDAYCDLLVAEDMRVGCLTHIGNEDNVRTIMTDAWHTPGSDGILVGDRPHPRGWGTFPRYLGTYVRELEILTLEECVRHMTSTACRRLGFADRGTIAPGRAADIVCFDPGTVSDRATYEEPKLPPDGIPYVLCNGRATVDEGKPTGDLAGRALRRTPAVDA